MLIKILYGGLQMLSKEKCCGVDLKVNNIKLQQQIDMYLEYYLTENFYNDDVNQDIKTYGIEIIKKEFLGNGKIIMEQKSVKHLSCDRLKVENLLNTLKEHTVTPMSLIDTLDSIIGVEF